MKQFISNVKTEYDLLTQLNDDDLTLRIETIKKKAFDSNLSDDLLAQWFALVQKVSLNKLGLKHFDTQLMAGLALHKGKIAEMKTGEGKKL